MRLKDMALEYRAASAKLALRIAEKQAAGASPAELSSLREALRDMRETRRLLDGYYDLPRSCDFAAVDWAGRRVDDGKYGRFCGAHAGIRRSLCGGESLRTWSGADARRGRAKESGAFKGEEAGAAGP